MQVEKPCLILVATDTIVHCKSDADLYETMENTENYTEGMVNSDCNTRIAIFSDGSVLHKGDYYSCADSDVYNKRVVSANCYAVDPFH